MTAEETEASLANEGERKTVTALFADIKGSTELMEELDPEEARAIIDPALKIMVEAVRHYDGYVVQSTGDGIFALFGAPVAHEDHPQLALYAALLIQQELRQHGQRAAHGRPALETRIGVNTGEVVVRKVETGGKVEYTPIGHTANLASRLQTVAPAGSIAVSERTYKLVEGYFELRGLGPTEVKGVSEPINVYEVIGPSSLRTHFQRSTRRGLTAFVGRDREIAELAKVLELANSGHGQIVAVVAEAGAGKSRLFYEFKLTLPGGCKVLEAYPVSYGKSSAYQPAIELLHGFFGIDTKDDPSVRRSKIAACVTTLDPAYEDALPYLFTLLGIQDQPDPLTHIDTQVKRRRTLEWIRRILLRESVRQPLVLIFEDLHWIDGETQALLNLVADSMAGARLLLLVNYRPEFQHDWNRKSYYTQLRLDPLGPDSVGQLLNGLLGDAVELAPLKRFLTGKTGGIPFFIEELVQTLFDEGVVVREGSKVKVTRSLSQVNIPTTVQGILASRIDRLPPRQKDLLQTLSVLGRNSPFDLVRAVVRYPDDELVLLLRELELSEFIYEQPGASATEFTFKHALTQEVAYGSLLVERRRLIHERAGDAIEKLFPDRLEQHLTELAYHYSHSMNTAKALSYLQRAGEHCAARSANAEAVLHFNTALRLLRTAPEGVEREHRDLAIQTRLGPILMTLHGYGSVEAEEVYIRARELCEKLGEDPQLFPVLWGLWLIHTSRGENQTGLELGHELLSLAGRLRDPGLLLQAHHALWNTLIFGGELTPGLEQAVQGLALYDPEAHSSQIALYGGHDTGICCHLHAAFALWLLGYPEQSMQKIEEALPRAKKLGHLNTLAWALMGASMIHKLRRETREAEERAEAAIQLSRDNGFALWVAVGDFIQGWARTERVQKEFDMAQMRRGLADVLATGTITWRAEFQGLLAERLGAKGETDAGLKLADEALSSAKTGWRWYEADLSRIKGDLLLLQDEENQAKAEECYLAAIGVAQRQSAKSLELRATTSLARLLAKQGHRGEARTMLAKIYGWFTEGFDTADLKDAKALLEELRE